MKKFKLISMAFSTAALAAMVALPASAQTSMTYAHSANPSASAAAQAFKTIVEGRSGGELTVDLVLHGALGGDVGIVDQIRLGEVEYYVPGISSLSNVAPSVQIFSAPYLFSDRREFYELMDDPEVVEYVRGHVLNESNNTIRFMGAAENSVRNLYTKNGPNRLPEDLSTTKLRVKEAPLNIQLWRALGVGNVVGMSGSERNQALQSGLIDGIEGSLSGAVTSGNMANLDHVTLSEHVYSYMSHLMNNDFYESLSPSLQTVVDDAVYLSIIVQNGMAIVEEHKAMSQLADMGLEVTVLTPEESAQWQAIARPVGEEFIENNVDPEFRETIMEALEQTRERIRN